MAKQSIQTDLVGTRCTITYGSTKEEMEKSIAHYNDKALYPNGCDMPMAQNIGKVARIRVVYYMKDEGIRLVVSKDHNNELVDLSIKEIQL